MLFIVEKTKNQNFSQYETDGTYIEYQAVINKE